MSCNLYLASKPAPPLAVTDLHSLPSPLLRRILLLLLISKVASALNTLRNGGIPVSAVPPSAEIEISSEKAPTSPLWKILSTPQNAGSIFDTHPLRHHHVISYDKKALEFVLKTFAILRELSHFEIRCSVIKP